MLSALFTDIFTQPFVTHEFDRFIYCCIYIAQRIEFACLVMGYERTYTIRIGAEYRAAAVGFPLIFVIIGVFLWWRRRRV